MPLRDDLAQDRLSAGSVEVAARHARVHAASEATQRKLGRIPGASDLKVEHWTWSGEGGGEFGGGNTIKVNDAGWPRWDLAQRIHVVAHELMHYADSLRPGFWGDYRSWDSRSGYWSNPHEIFAEHRAAAVSGRSPDDRFGSLVGAFGF